MRAEDRRAAVDEAQARRGLVGVLGGMGPLASSHFLDQVYRLAARAGQPEQTYPRVVLLSDPTFPDRTALLREGRRAEGALRLAEGLRTLQAAGAEQFVITCFTAHAFVGLIPGDLQARLISLIDVARPCLEESPSGPLLLLATEGTLGSGVFEPVLEARSTSEKVRVPSASERARIHQLLYELKGGLPRDRAAERVIDLLDGGNAVGVVAGCTEVHLIHAELEARGVPVVDPLMTLAHRIALAEGNDDG